LNLTRDLNSKVGLNIFNERKRNKKGFEILSEIKSWLGSEMRFESSDLIQIDGYSKSGQGFGLEDFPNLKRCQPFQDRKVEIWS
jgi:hypothetical protein